MSSRTKWLSVVGLAGFMAYCGRPSVPPQLADQALPGEKAIRIAIGPGEIRPEDARILGYGVGINTVTPRVADKQLAHCAKELGVKVEEIFVVTDTTAQISNAKYKALVFKQVGVKQFSDWNIDPSSGATLRGVCVFGRGSQNFFRLRITVPVEKVVTELKGARNRAIVHHAGQKAPSYKFDLSEGSKGSQLRIWSTPRCPTKSAKTGGWAVDCRAEVR